MNRYIEAGSLKEKFTSKWILDRIDQHPTADVVEVVRCGDCCYQEHCRVTNVWAVPPPDSWFCADGKRREDDKE